MPESSASVRKPDSGALASALLRGLTSDDDVAGFDTLVAGTAAFEDMAQIIAHRIRSLLTSIEGFADLLGEMVSDPDERDLLFRIIESTARIEHVLADLLLYARPIEPMLLPLPAAHIMDGLRTTFDDERAERVEYQIELPPGAKITGDPLLLRQALLIMLQNALDAIHLQPEGRVLARISSVTEEGRVVYVFSVLNPGFIALAEPEVLVFRPFFTTKAQNLGLGLPIARRIAEVHGGTLELAVNHPGSGVQFNMKLPAGED